MLDLTKFEGHIPEGPWEPYGMSFATEEDEPGDLLWVGIKMPKPEMSKPLAEFFAAAPQLLEECNRLREKCKGYHALCGRIGKRYNIHYSWAHNAAKNLERYLADVRKDRDIAISDAKQLQSENANLRARIEELEDGLEALYGEGL